MFSELSKHGSRMDLGFTNKVVLITGSSRGIGFAMAQAFYREGAQVVLNGMDVNTLDAAIQTLPGATGFAADVRVPGECARLIESVLNIYGRLDVLVCNVGSGRSVNPGDETLDEWQRVFAINVWSTTNMVEASKKTLSDSSGVIVCTSSICGLEVLGAPVTYAAAKAALNQYVKGIARPLADMGVRINAVVPGNILFDGSIWQQRLRDNVGAVETMLQRDVAMHRLGRPEEVADCVLFLASERAGFITGSLMKVDGGHTRS